MRDFKLKESKQAYGGRVIDLFVERIILPDGTEATREVVRHPGAAAIVPLFSPDEVVLLRQFRYCAGKELWEIPAGTLEPGELPLECARRELIEETGYRAGRMIPLGGFFTSPGFCTEFIHLFLATELEPCAASHDADEQLVPQKITLEDAIQKIEDGDIVDAKTIVGLLKLSRMRPEI